MMSSRCLLLFCGALFLSACTSPASRTDASAGADVPAAGTEVASATASAAPEDDPLVCRSIMRTGTRVAERHCMRQSEIDARSRGGQEFLGDVQRRSTHTGNPVGN